MGAVWGAGDAAAGVFEAAGDAAAGAFEAAGDAASGAFEGAGSLAEGVLSAAADVVQGVSEAMVALVQSAAWSFGGLLHDTCETVTLVVRFVAAVQCSYVIYRVGRWAAPPALERRWRCWATEMRWRYGSRRSAARELTDGEAAQRGLSPCASACEAGDGPERSLVTRRQALAQVFSPGGAGSSADSAPSPVLALWRDSPFGTPDGGVSGGPRPEVL